MLSVPGALLFGSLCITLSISSAVTGVQYTLLLHEQVQYFIYSDSSHGFRFWAISAPIELKYSFRVMRAAFWSSFCIKVSFHCARWLLRGASGMGEAVARSIVTDTKQCVSCRPVRFISFDLGPGGPLSRHTQTSVLTIHGCLLHCALASCGAVYCNRSCLWVCLCVGLCVITRNYVHRSSPNWVCS